MWRGISRLGGSVPLRKLEGWLRGPQGAPGGRDSVDSGPGPPPRARDVEKLVVHPGGTADPRMVVLPPALHRPASTLLQPLGHSSAVT